MSEGFDELAQAERFARISDALKSESPGEPTLQRTVELAVQTIPACGMAGIAQWMVDGHITTMAVTDPLVERVDALQNELAEGPSRDVIWGTMNDHVIDDLGSESRWARWASQAVHLGIQSVLSIRLDITKHTGVLSLYAQSAQAFDATDLAVASIFARHAAVALEASERYTGMRTALRSRQTIGVAQGMLMQRYRLSLDQSFEVLRRYSNQQNIKLRDLAEQLVRTGYVSDDFLEGRSTSE